AADRAVAESAERIEEGTSALRLVPEATLRQREHEQDDHGRPAAQHPQLPRSQWERDHSGVPVLSQGQRTGCEQASSGQFAMLAETSVTTATGEDRPWPRTCSTWQARSPW